MFKVYKIGELDTFNISDIIKSMKDIDFSPVYQRYSNIWDNYKKQLLIDTIFNEYDVPKFYFNYFIDTNNPLNKYDKLYAVIDGKQRLEAIIDFVSNKLAVNLNIKLQQSEQEIVIVNKTFNEIQTEYSELTSQFLKFKLDIIFIATDEEDRLEDMFLRLNGGEALTNAEKRNAIGGQFNIAMREIVESNAFFLNKVKFSNKRFQHQDLLTKLVFIDSKNELISMTNKVLDDFVRANKIIQCQSNIDNVLDILYALTIVFEDKSQLLKGKGVIPVYYYFIKTYRPEISLFKEFLQKFEDLRILNKRLPENQQNSTLIDYDRHNQQGVHTQKSLMGRYDILVDYYNSYLGTGQITIHDIDTKLSDDE